MKKQSLAEVIVEENLMTHNSSPERTAKKKIDLLDTSMKKQQSSCGELEASLRKSIIE